MDFEEVYLNLMPLATSFGAGYEFAQHDLLQMIAYSVITSMFVGENMFGNSKNSKSNPET